MALETKPAQPTELIVDLTRCRGMKRSIQAGPDIDFDFDQVSLLPSSATPCDILS